MTNDGENVESLREQLRHCQAALDKKDEYIARLTRANKTLSDQIQEARDSGQAPAEISEIEETLRRLLTRIGMILQGSKCVFMSHDTETDELFADTPALGFEDAEVKKLRVKATEGISGEVFRENHSVILYDAETDERAKQERLDEFGIKNGVCVPLAIERRDEETNRVLDRKLIGVLWVFNKKFGNIFIDEDIQLLERMARNTAAIINTAEKFRQIIKERDEVIEMTEALTMGLIMVNTNQRITQMNNSALKIFGLTKDDLASGNSLETVIQDEKVREMLTRAISSDGDVAEEVTLPDPQSPDQNHVFQVQSATVRNDAGDTIGTATIFNDITEIKNVDKMKTAFVSTVSHELRTPLTSIKGFISTLVQDTEGFYTSENRQEFYTIIDTECDRLRRLIDDLLNVSRIESGNAIQMNLTDVDLRSVTDRVITIQNGSTYRRPNHHITAEFDPAVPKYIQADEDMVNQILANLVSNALKYSPKGGEVRITAKMMSPELVQFAVSDQGMGIPKEHLSRMFQRFHRVDNRDTREIGGTGIGLFLVKALVEQHHGRIWLDSEYGAGATFYFTLPTHQPDDNGSDDGNLSQRVAG